MGKFPKYKYLFAISDFILLIITFVLAMYLFRSVEVSDIGSFVQLSFPIIMVYTAAALLYIFIFQINNLYKVNIIIYRSAHLTTLIKSFYYGAVPVILISLVIRSNDFTNTRLVFFGATLLQLFVFYFIRVEVLRIILLKINRQFKKNVAIIGDGDSGKLLAAKLLFENPEGINLVGFVDFDNSFNSESMDDIKLLGRIDNLGEIYDEYKLDEIIIAIDRISYDRLLEILDVCHKLKVDLKLSSELFSIVSEKVSTEKYADIPLLGITPRYNNVSTLVLKRIFDILVSSSMTVLFSPFLIIIAVLIKLTSSGPLIFKQKRIGKDGKQFNMYKFRSMYSIQNEVDEERKEMMIAYMQEEENTGESSKVIVDDRITSIGKFIRKTSLDELPQLFNVIKGDMSLVGPRPCLPYEYEHYDTWQKRRVNALPGCTGVWQVWGRSTVSFKESIVLDLYYINSMSPWLDLHLLIKTIPVILFGRGGK